MGYKNKIGVSVRGGRAWQCRTAADEADTIGVVTYRFGSCRQVSHMPDADRLVVREVDASLHRQEAVDLALGAELGAEALDVHGRGRGRGLHLLVVCHRGVSFKIIPRSAAARF